MSFLNTLLICCKERNIQEEWVKLVNEDPERKEMEQSTTYGLLSSTEDDTYVLW